MPSNGREKWIGLFSFGFFIMLFALFFIVVPDYYTRVRGFLGDFEMREVASNLFLPAPAEHHPVVYETVMRFCIVFGSFQFIVLALRFYFISPWSKIAETISNIVFWMGVAYIFNLLLLQAITWFALVGGIIAVVGFSIITRSLVLLLVLAYKH